MNAQQAAASLPVVHQPEVGEPLGNFDFDDILKMIPHRYPMLMLDRLTNVVAFKSAIGIKNVTFNEPFFQGHFPTDPIMPGVLVVEALAQAAGALVVASLGHEARGSIVYFMSVDRAKFRKPVRPGNQIVLEVALIQSKLNVFKFEGRAVVDGRLATEATFSAMMGGPSARKTKPGMISTVPVE